MRDFKGMKRQRGRNRSSGGNSGKPQHNTNRAFDSNGPDGVKVRGAAQHVYEKYQQLARDAHTSGDRVLAENYLQHAEHYFRVMRAMQPQRPVSEIIGRDQFVSGYDIDFEDESGQGEVAEPEANEGALEHGESADRFEPRREERPRDERPRDDYRAREDYRPREDLRPRDDRPRDDRTRDDRTRDERPRDERDRAQSDRFQGERAQGERPPRSYRDDRSRYGRDERSRTEPADRPSVDAMAIVEPEATPLPSQPPTSLLRADDGDVSHAPAFLQVRPAEPRDEAAPPPRRTRRRTPRTFETAEAVGADGGGEPSGGDS